MILKKYINRLYLNEYMNKLLKKEELKILSQLDKNSRMSIKLISKKTKLKKNKVVEILKNLKKENIVKNYFPMVEFRDLRYFFGLIFIKLKKNINKQGFFTNLLKSKNNTIIMELDGDYDAFVAISIKGLNKLNYYMKSFNDHFLDYIYHYDSFIANGFFRFFRGYLLEIIELNKKTEVTGRDKKNYPIDPIDLKIISYLNRDCRTYSNDKIAKILEMPAIQVKQRIKFLEKVGILQNYTILLNHKEIGIDRYRILFKTTGFSRDFEKKFINFCNKHKNIIHYLRLFGNYDFLVEVEFFNKKNKINKIMEDLKKILKEKIINFKKLKVIDIYRYKDIVSNPK